MTEKEKLLKELGMEKGQLLQSQDGHVADILRVEGDQVTLGYLDKRGTITVNRNCLVKERPVGRGRRSSS